LLLLPPPPPLLQQHPHLLLRLLLLVVILLLLGLLLLFLPVLFLLDSLLHLLFFLQLRPQLRLRRGQHNHRWREEVRWWCELWDPSEVGVSDVWALYVSVCGVLAV
jgi:hypothetical protein